MRTKLIVAGIIAAVAGGSFLAKALLDRAAGDRAAESARPGRIVSMSPSVTEILFELELGDRVVGVTRFCEYPPQATKKAKVGGLHDPNFEAIVALEPDLVILRETSEKTMAAFEELELDTLVVCHKNVEGILDSIGAIGHRCGAEEEAERVVAGLRSEIQRIERKTAGLERPRVMFAVQRTLDEPGKIQNVYVAGREGFIDRVITLAGGENACPDSLAGFPVVSAEGIMQMNPQVILDMSAAMLKNQSKPQRSKQAVLADWEQLAEVEAVRDGRVYLLEEDYAFIPGPRFLLLAGKLARLIHPEVNWQQ